MFWLSIFDEVENIIKSWQPDECTTEKEFEQSLLKGLQNKLKDKKIETSYGSGRQRIDIVVDDKVPIEIKKDLKSTSANHRLIGQLEEYLKKWDKLIVVLCGDIASDLLTSLRDYATSKEEYLPIDDERVIIIVKGVIRGT